MALNKSAENFVKFFNKDDSGLDDIEKSIVVMVAENGRMNVTPIIQSGVASPATIHKRLKGLYEKDFLKIGEIEGEYPKRAVELATTGNEWLTKMGRAMKEATR